MLANQGSACATLIGLPPASYAAGANNGSWIDVRALEGEILVNVELGAVTGSTVVKVQDAVDGSGTGAADIAGATTASLSAANSTAKILVPAGLPRGWVRVVSTVVTGPIVHAVGLIGHPKYA